MFANDGDVVILSDVAVNIRGNVAPSSMDQDAEYILLEHIVSGTGQVRPSRVCDHVVSSPKNSYQPGDILFGKLRPNLRKVCVAQNHGYCSTDIIPLRTRDGSCSDFVAALLRSDGFMDEVMRRVSGANLPRIGVRDLMSLPILWPPTEKRAQMSSIAREVVELRNELNTILDSVAEFEKALWSR